MQNPTRWDLLTDEEILNKYFNESKVDNPHFTLEEHMEFAIGWANNSSIKDAEFVLQQQAQTFQSFDERTGVLCLTEYPAEKEMWDKYAVNHTGFCVGFDPNIMLNGLGSGGGIVHYEEELPIIHPIQHSYLERSVRQIFYKLKHWSFEKEYRSYKFRNYPLPSQERKVIVSHNAFKEIILGASIAPESERELLASIPPELQHVQIKKALLDGGEIKIVNYQIPE